MRHSNDMQIKNAILILLSLLSKSTLQSYLRNFQELETDPDLTFVAK